MISKPTHPLLRTLDTLVSDRTGGWFLAFVVIPLLGIIALILPPISLPGRILSAGYTGISPSNGGGVSVSDGALFSIPPGATKRGAAIRLGTTPRESFLKSSLASSLPTTLDVKSPLYQPGLQGEMPSLSILSIPIPDAAEPLATLTVYGYLGKKWTKLPFQIFIDDQRIETYLTTAIPEAVVVAQTQAQTPTLSANLSAKNPLPSQSSAFLAEVNPSGLTIADGGGVSGSVPAAPEASASSPYQVFPTVSNIIDDQVRGDLVDDVISNPETRRLHVQALVDLAVEKLYPGLNVDYQNVSPDNRDNFTAFVRELAQVLQDKNKMLGVTLAMPTQISADTWETGAFDWAEIGKAADIVNAPLPFNRDAYLGESPFVQTYLQWAVGQVDHFKLQLDVSMLGRDEFGASFAPVGFSRALKLLGPIDASGSVALGDKITFDLPKLREAGGIKFDAVTGLYSFPYKDDKGTHTVSLENAESLAKKIALALQFNLRGMVLRDLGADQLDPRVWDALKQYRDGQVPSVRGNLAIVWRVNGQTVGKTTVSDPKHVWTAPTQTGDQKVEAVLSFDAGQTAAGTAGVTTVQVVKGTAPKATTEAPEISSAPPRPTTAPKPPAAAAAPGNFSGQNLFNYGAQLNWTNIDSAQEMAWLTGMSFKWAKIQVRWCDLESAKGVADLSQIDRFMGAANRAGIKVMFSVVCAPRWARRDGGAGGSGPPDNMQDAADFMGGLAGVYCSKGLGAIEVWNEHNLLTEWHGQAISAARYMEMLRLSYQKIRTACPSVLVVSGAPTPTGVMSDTAIDDVVFLQQMYQNGLKQYSDAIGAHPSGFCNAPEAAEGAPNPCGGQFNNHRSFFFRRTIESYRAVMTQNGDNLKQIWATEFGWGVDPTPKPGYEYERAISEDAQAQWLVKAYQMMKSYGYVGVAFLWNLDFTDMGNETGAFHILNRPAYNALSGMPK